MKYISSDKEITFGINNMVKRDVIRSKIDKTLLRIFFGLLLPYLLSYAFAAPGLYEYESSSYGSHYEYESSRQNELPQQNVLSDDDWCYIANLRRAKNGDVIARFVMLTLNEYEARIRHAADMGDTNTVYNTVSSIDSFVNKHYDTLLEWVCIGNLGPRCKIVADRLMMVLDESYKNKWGVFQASFNSRKKAQNTKKGKTNKALSVENGQITYMGSTVDENRAESLPKLSQRSKKDNIRIHKVQYEIQRQQYIKEHPNDPDAFYFIPSLPPMDRKTGTIVIP